MKRVYVGLIAGAVLGVFCIIGANARSTEPLTTAYLFGFWYNRVIMGLLIGLISFDTSLSKRLLRGFIVGIVVSFAFYSATEFYDLLGFLVGGVYGIIIEYVTYKYAK